MIALEQARQYMEKLGLTEAVEVLDSRLDAAAKKQMPYPDMPGPAAAPQPCPQHPGRKLQAQGQAAGRAADHFAPAAQSIIGGTRWRQYTDWGWVNTKPAIVGQI